MKRIVSVGLAAWLLLTLLSAGAVGVSAARDATIVVSETSGFAGDTVSVSIRFENNPGLISALVGVKYDATALQLVKMEAGDFPDGAYTAGPLTENPFSIVFIDALAGKNCTKELFATLQFKIKESAPAGEYPIHAICNFEENFCNTNWDAVWFDVQAGGVTVKQASASATHTTLPYSTAAQSSSAVVDTTEASISSPSAGRSEPSEEQPSVSEVAPPAQSVAKTTVRPYHTVAKLQDYGTKRPPIRPIFIVLIVVLSAVGVGSIVAVVLLLRKKQSATPPEGE